MSFADFILGWLGSTVDQIGESNIQKNIFIYSPPSPLYFVKRGDLPTIIPDPLVYANELLFPNSYCLCSFPFDIQSTSGSCMLYTLFLSSLCCVSTLYKTSKFTPCIDFGIGLS